MAKDHAGHNSASQELETDPAPVPPESLQYFAYTRITSKACRRIENKK